MSDKSVTLTLRIDKELRREFKTYTSMYDETMTDVLVKMIKEYVEEKKNKSEWCGYGVRELGVWMKFNCKIKIFWWTW